MLNRLPGLWNALLRLRLPWGSPGNRWISQRRPRIAIAGSFVLISAAILLSRYGWLPQSLLRGSVADFAPQFAASSQALLSTDTALLLGSVSLVLMGGILLATLRTLRNQRRTHARYKAIIEQANDGIVVADSLTHQLLDANPAFLAALGYSDADLATLNLRDIIGGVPCPADDAIARIRADESARPLHVQLNRKDGTLLDVEVRCNPLDVDGRSAFVYVVHDVSVRRKAEQQLIDNQQRLDRMAHHDQLTGLPNRHYLAAFLPEAIAEAAESGTMLGIVFIDLDRFKHINDTRGHEVGDRLLQEVAVRVRSCVRDNDVVIRMGGDEFVVVFRHLTSSAEVTQGAARIVEMPERCDRH